LQGAFGFSLLQVVLPCPVLFLLNGFICCRQALERKGRDGHPDGWMDGWRRAGVMEQLFFGIICTGFGTGLSVPG
jgi:hypothetical protein